MRRPGTFALLAVLAACPAMLSTLLADDPPASPPHGHEHESAEPGVLTIGGTIVCLDFDLLPIADERRCDEPGAARFALQTPGGQWFFFLEQDPRAGMFADPVVRSRELSVRGWPREDDHFEILEVFSVLDGQLHDLYYRCEVCNITATAPGPCWCCGQPFELREPPVGSPNES